MKKIIACVVVLSLLIGGGWIAVQALDPVGRVRMAAADAVKAQTGRDLAFESARLMVWPNIGVRLKGVTISNSEWSQQKDMIKLAAIEVRLVTQALLEKRFEVAQFVLQEPVILLEKSKDGKANWQFKPETSAQAEPATNSPDASAIAKEYGFKLGEFLINKGTVTYIDHASMAEEKVSDVNIVITMPDLESAAQVDGAFVWRGKKLQVVVHAENPSHLLQGLSSPGGVSIKGPDAVFEFTGDIATAGVLAAGQMKADVSSLAALAAWASGQDVKTLPYQKLSFDAAGKFSANKISLSNAKLSLDDLAMSGDVSVSLASVRPDIMARVAVDKIVLDRFMPKPQEANAGKAAKSEAGWDAAPLDLSALNSADLDLVIKTGGFSLKGIDVGASDLSVNVNNGVLKASASQAALLGGSFKSTLAANASAAVPTFGFSFNMKGVESKPVLVAFADFKNLSGKVDADIDVTARGKSQKEIIEQLSGKGAVTFKNGAFEGIDLVNIAKLLQQNLGDMGVGEGKTEFVDLGGTFTIAKGTATNKDLKMRGPLVQASGSGDIDLPKKFLRYRVIPVLTASSAVEGAKGLSIPVDIKGPFSAIKVKPDYKSVITNTLKDPYAIKDTVKNAQEQLKNIKNDPGAALEGLLGGAGLFGSKPKEPEVSGETVPASP